ncbi:MAG: hypothetical protein AAFY29_07535 [Pseudomonadota bacterium]
MKNVVYALLDLLMEELAYVALIWLILAIVGLGLMVAAIIRRPASRAVSVSMLVLALGYAIVNVAVFRFTVSIDAFAIFTAGYLLACSAALPLLGLAAMMLLWRRYESTSWDSVSGYILSIGCATFAHLYVVAAVSASV